jgi:RNase P/RNase MRP subunit p30
MSTKSNPLQHGWTVIAHSSYQVFTNKNAYVVIDEDNDVVIRLAVQENEVEVLSSNWNLNYKINIGFKTIKILNSPEAN